MNISVPDDLAAEVRTRKLPISAICQQALRNELGISDVTIPQYHLDVLLAVATLYIGAFQPDERFTLPGKMALQEVEDVVKTYGKRY